MSGYQNNFIQNSEDFKAKNEVLERNYNRATIHHFHFKRLSLESFYFIQLLKSNLKKTRHKLKNPIADDIAVSISPKAPALDEAITTI